MVGKAPIYKLSHRKAPKRQQIRHYRHTTKAGEFFLLFNTVLVSAITLLTQVPLQKFPLLFIFIIPWCNASYVLSYLLLLQHREDNL